MKRSLSAIVGASVILAVSTVALAAAGDPSTRRGKVLGVSCYASARANSYTCLAYLEGGIGTCPRTDAVGWSADDAHGQNVLSLFTAAKLAAKEVTVRTKAGCFGDGYPLLEWMKLE